LLKTSAKKAGLRYTSSQALEHHIGTMIRQHSEANRGVTGGGYGSRAWSSLAGAAAVILLAVGLAGTLLWVGHRSEANVALAKRAALETEAIDQHIATLAADSPPQVISSDRHTVKPWFQGKLPFTFNLPDNLPADTKLEGADLTYIHDQPAAQLLYSIGKHRVSVFITQRTSKTVVHGSPSDHAGFHVVGFVTRDLDAIAVSDVDPGRLSGLVGEIFVVQSGVALPAN
jgi:anti-sigma factor RsiW